MRFLLQTCAIVREATDRMMSLPCHMANGATGLHQQVEAPLRSSPFSLAFEDAAPIQGAHDIAYAAPLPLAIGQ